MSFSPDGKILASGSADGSIRLWDMPSLECYKIFINGKNGTWLSYNKGSNRLLRYDDGTFLTKLKGNHRVPIAPPVPDKEAHLIIFQKPESITTHDGGATEFSIDIQNNGKGPLYWIRIDPVSEPFSKDKPIDPIVFYPPRIHAVLKSGKTVRMPCKVSAFSGRMNPKEQTAALRLKISSHFTEPVLVTIPVHVRLPVIAVSSAKLLKQEEKTLIVSLENSGGNDLDKNIECSAVIDKKRLQRVEMDPLKAGQTAEIAFVVPAELSLPKQPRLKLQIVKPDYPVREWIYGDIPVKIPVPPWYLYAVLTALTILLGFTIYRVRIYYHPLVIQLSHPPHSLTKLDLRELTSARKLLKSAGRLEAVLTAAGVHLQWLDRAVSFLKIDDAEKKCKLICARIGIRSTPDPAMPYPAFELSMHSDFILNIVDCVAVFPPDHTPVADILAALKGMGRIRRICLLVTTHAPLQTELRKRSLNPSNRFVTPNFSELTTLLLSPEPEQELARIISRQISVTQISPYKTGGGVDRESIFFGRTRILSHIMNREPSNYLIVGGRQVGKSTILKALERRYEDEEQIDCRYIVMHGADIATELADHAGLSENTGLSDIIHCLGQKKSGRRRLFLIDEADAFIHREAASGYKTLRQLRSLSETGDCHFILAGFWELYRAATLDYYSPIKNFGEMITIGALEPEACRDLAVKPMESLNIRYEADELVDLMIHATGARANLIALTCNEMLRNLDTAGRTLGESDVKIALASNAVQTALSGWEGLTGNALFDRMDRIVVYAGIILQHFTINDLTTFLKKSDDTYAPQHLRESLFRLELAFILKKEHGTWSFCIPLFEKLIQQWNPASMLAGEIADRNNRKSDQG